MLTVVQIRARKTAERPYKVADADGLLIPIDAVDALAVIDVEHGDGQRAARLLRRRNPLSECEIGTATIRDPGQLIGFCHGRCLPCCLLHTDAAQSIAASCAI